MKVKDVDGVERDIKRVRVEVSRYPDGLFYFCFGTCLYSGLFNDRCDDVVLFCSRDVNEALDFAEDLDLHLAGERNKVLENARFMGIIMS